MVGIRDHVNTSTHEACLDTVKDPPSLYYSEVRTTGNALKRLLSAKYIQLFIAGFALHGPSRREREREREREEGRNVGK